MRRYTQKTALVTLSDINITPLLDLAFVLLIIFMITTPLMEQSLRLELPTGQVADGTPEKNDLILVEVNAEGELFLESEATNLTDLQQRLAEDFKLTTGTRVKTGVLRHALLAACAPLVRDVAIAGAGRDRLAVILFPADTDVDPDDLRNRLATHNNAMPGSSTAIARAIVSATPPDANAGEINDKGHLVQARCLSNRAETVACLYADPPDADIIALDTDKDQAT